MTVLLAVTEIYFEKQSLVDLFSFLVQFGTLCNTTKIKIICKKDF